MEIRKFIYLKRPRPFKKTKEKAEKTKQKKTVNVLNQESRCEVAKHKSGAVWILRKPPHERPFLRE